MLGGIGRNKLSKIQIFTWKLAVYLWLKKKKKTTVSSWSSRLAAFFWENPTIMCLQFSHLELLFQGEKCLQLSHRSAFPWHDPCASACSRNAPCPRTVAQSTQAWCALGEKVSRGEASVEPDWGFSCKCEMVKPSVNTSIVDAAPGICVKAQGVFSSCAFAPMF